MDKSAGFSSSIPFNLSARAAEALATATVGGVAGAVVGSRRASDLDAELEWKGKDGKTYRRARTKSEKGRRKKSVLKGLAIGAMSGAAISPVVSATFKGLLSTADELAAKKMMPKVLGEGRDMQAAMSDRLRDLKSTKNLTARQKSEFSYLTDSIDKLKKLRSGDRKRLLGELSSAEKVRSKMPFGLSRGNPSASWTERVNSIVKNEPFSGDAYRWRMESYLKEMTKISSCHERASTGGI